MKFLNLILVALILSSCSKNEEQQVVEIDYWTTQEELNSFQNELDNTGIFEGDITVGHDINDLSALSNLTEITGELSISASKLEKIHLPELEYVSKLELRGNNTLKTIDLPKIKTISDYILIFGNSELKTIQMNELQSIEEYGVNIVDNDSLIMIELQKLESYRGLNIRWNPLLKHLNLRKSIPEKCEDIRLQFDFIDTHSVLFQNSSDFCFLEVEILNANNSNLNWLINLDGDNILNHTYLVGEFETNQFCFLKEKLSQMNYPLNFKVGKSFNSTDFTGLEIIRECN